jgi:hypothetical protein
MGIVSSHIGAEIQLDSCPYCGSDKIELNHIGNEYTKSRKIEIKCTGCRVKRQDAAIKHGFDWLENISVKAWNQRHTQ